jgi:CubicO group peptidase (beta-lactamase class C family)
MKFNTIFVFLFLSCSLQNYAQDYQKVIKKTHYLIEQHQQQTDIPGIQVAVFVEDTLVWSEAFSFKDIKNQKLVDNQTRFRIASVSKPMTSVALAKMMQDSMIDIDQNIDQYLENIPVPWQNITPRQLATSTSGIRHYTSEDAVYNTTDYPDVVSALEKFKNDPLLFEPGTDYHYSSYGWVLLSAVMESAAKQSFFEIMQKTWSELGMQQTNFDFPDNNLDNTSSFYIHDKKQGRVIAPSENRSFMYAGGGYLSTAEDLVKMGKALFKNSYLTEEITRELFQPQVIINGESSHYGLGWEVGESRLNTPIAYHSGSMNTTRSHLILYPEEHVIFAYLANTGDSIFFNDREAQNIAELFVQEKRGKASKTNDSISIEGEWEISTTSLRNKKSKGILKLETDEDGMIKGQIKFKRSRKEETYPVLLSEMNGNQAHLIAVTPMFIDFFITLKENTFSGTWQYDFNVKGVPESDKYWKARSIKGHRI